VEKKFRIGYYFLLRSRTDDQQYRSEAIYAFSEPIARGEIIKKFPLAEWEVRPDGTTQGDVQKPKKLKRDWR
jgi:hypothetical protein